jgi:hypothetical protein
MASKLCPHSLRPTADAKRLIQAGSRLVKMVDDFGAAAEYFAINPNLTLIGRGYVTYTLLQQLESGATPSEAARHFVLDQKARYYDRNPLIKIWEGHNEPSFGAPNDKDALKRMEWYAQFEAARLGFMADLGLRGVVGNFSTGYPEIKPNDLRMWSAFLPALEACQGQNGILGLHEYSAPWIWWMTGNYQRNNCPDLRFAPNWRLEDVGAMGWTTLRYRQIYKYALAPHHLDNVPLIITEFGADAVGNNCSGTPSGVWRDLLSFWNAYDGTHDPIDYWRKPERDGERYFAEQLIWYDREIQKDAYVLGAMVFTFGASSATWEPYRIDETRIPRFLAAHIEQSRHEPTLPLPPLQPLPPPVSVTPDPADSPPGTPIPMESDPFADSPLDPEVEPNPIPLPTSAPAPAQPVIPNRGQPRNQYSRIYILLPPNATDPAWVEAVAEATWHDRRFTIGASADDAGIGNLHARLAVVVNPQSWGTTPPIDQWFAKNYPGVAYISIKATTPAELATLLQTTPLAAPILVRPSAPQPPWGIPSSQYTRTYILMNPSHTDPAWVQAVARAAWARRVTIGGSADDAGIGDLASRQVLILNPTENYDSDIFAWFAQNYPGVQTTGLTAASPADLGPKLKQALGL